jgi:hypothetical protein
VRGPDVADEELVVVDRVDDAVLASPSRPVALQLEPQRVADPIRVVGERAMDKVDDGRGNRFR